MMRLVLLVVVVLGALSIPLWPIGSPQAIVADPLALPTSILPLGSDQFGRDVLARLLWAAHLTVRNALFVLGLIMPAVVSGSLLFAIMPAALRRIIQQVNLIILAIPSLLLAIALLIALPAIPAAAVAIGLLPLVLRYTNTLVEAQLTSPYAQNARLHGASALRIAIEHVLPHLIPRVAAFAVVIFVWSVLSFTSLEFLGLVGSPSSVSLGRLLDDGRQVIAQAPRLVIAPSLLLFALALLGGTRYNGRS